MKIIFFGTSEFAVPGLKKLAESRHEVLLVVTQPDRKKGRHLHLAAPPVKIEAQRLNIPVEQPAQPSGKGFIELLKKQNADLFVVISYGHILKKELLKVPKLYSINLHASLLPKYRGAAPINWAIIKGEDRSGISLIRMTEKMDGGDIILSKEIRIMPDDTSRSANKRLSEIGARLLLDALRLIKKGKAEFVRQNKKSASYAPKLKKEDGLINWNKKAFEIHNLIRGLIPWPGAYTYWKGKTLKIWRSEVDPIELRSSPGQVADVSNKGISVKTSRGSLIITQLQLEGGKRMDAASFLRGHKIQIGDKVG